jgi:hypothetical protein
MTVHIRVCCTTEEPQLADDRTGTVRYISVIRGNGFLVRADIAQIDQWLGTFS